MYRFSMAQIFKNNYKGVNHPHKKIFYVMRAVSLALLVFLIAKPQLVDSHSKVSAQGIDIMLAIDISGSMEMQDDERDVRSRVEIAKAEAIRFIEKRTNDAIGLVIFAQDAVSRCPLTHDKRMVRHLVQNLQIGQIDHLGTVLATALISAMNRLKNSKAKSKVIILLTDGEPSENDTPALVAIEAAKRLDVKVYTIGIGGDKPVFVQTMYGIARSPGVNVELLKKIAHDTGGKFFMARNAQDMRTIYDTIDSLEKTDNETPVFSNYWDIFIPFIWLIITLLLTELVLSTYIWFGI
jgi:Ca-activated chloride channel family protein